MEKKFVSVREAECGKAIGENTEVALRWDKVTCRECNNVKKRMKVDSSYGEKDE